MTAKISYRNNESDPTYETKPSLNRPRDSDSTAGKMVPFFEALRESWSYLAKHPPAFVKAHAAAPETALRFVDHYRDAPEFTDALFDTIPEVALHMTRMSPYAIGVEVLGGSWQEPYLVSWEDISKMPPLQQHIQGQTRAAQDLFRAANWAIHSATHAAGNILKSRYNNIKSGFLLVKTIHQNLWLRREGETERAGPFKNLDEALMHFNYADHVKEVQSEYELTDRETALYLIAGRDCFLERLDSQGFLNLKGLSTAPEVKDLKNELSLESTRFDIQGLTNDLEKITSLGPAQSDGIDLSPKLLEIAQVASLYGHESMSFGLKLLAGVEKPKGAVEQIKPNVDFSSGKTPLDLAQKADELAAFMEKEKPLSSTEVEHLDNFISEASQWHTTYQHELVRAAKTYHALKVGEAVFEQFEVLQRMATTEMVEQHQEREEAKSIHFRHTFSQNQQAWFDHMSKRMSLGRWVNREMILTLQGLKESLAELRSDIAAFTGKEGQLKSEINGLLRQQQEWASREASRKRRRRRKLLRIVVSALKVAAVVAGPFAPVLEAGLAVGVGLAGAASQSNDHQILKERLARQEGLNHFDREIQMRQLDVQMLKQESIQSDQEYHAILDEIIINKDLYSPEARRYALDEQYNVIYQKGSESYHAQFTRFTTNESKLSAEYLVWKTNHRRISKALDELKRKIKEEKAVAHIADRGWRVAQYWGYFWAGDDKDTLNFSRAVNESIQRYHISTADERQAFENTFCAFETLGYVTGSENMVKYAQIAHGFYLVGDKMRYAYTTAMPTLKDVWTSQHRIDLAIGGIPSLLLNYLVPGVLAAIATIQLYHSFMGKKELTFQEQMLQHLGHEFRGLGFSINQISKQNQFLYDQLNQCLQSIEETRQELLHDLRKGFLAAKRDRDERQYQQVTRRLKLQVEKMKVRRSSFQDSKAFLDQLTAEVKSSVEDINNGVLFTSRDQLVQTPGYFDMVYRNPGFYTGMLASIVSRVPEKIPSLHRFLEGFFGYQAVSKISVDPKVEALRALLLEQGKALHRFFGDFSSICSEAYAEQQKLVAEVMEITKRVLESEKRDRMEYVKRLGRRFQVEMVALKTGRARFGLSIAVANRKNEHLKLPDRDLLLAAGNRQFRDANHRVATTTSAAGVNGLGMGLGALYAAGAVSLLSSPVGWGAAAVWAIKASIAGALMGGTAGLVGSGIDGQLSQELAHILKRPIKIDLKKVDALTNSTSLLIDIVAKKRLSELSIHLISMRRESCAYNNYPLCSSEELNLQDKEEIGISKSREYVDDYKNQPVKIMQIQLFQEKETEQIKSQAILSSAIPISATEVTNIPEFYGKSYIPDSIINDYFNWIEAGEGIWCGIPKNEAEVIPADRVDLLPLAFPKRVVEIVYREANKLASKGYQLRPKYSFNEPLKGHGYELKLHWSIYQAGKILGERAELILARFDSDTVRSFGAPFLEEGKLKQEEPNINEFLMHALYGIKMGEEVGLPGKKTIAMKEKEIVVPVDIPFAGLFALQAEKPQFVGFNSRCYSGLESLEYKPLNVRRSVVSGVSSSLWEKAPPRFRRYSELRNVVKAMLINLTQVKIESLEKHMCEIGLVIPDDEDLFYAFLAENPRFPEVSPERECSLFEQLSEPSDERKLLVSALVELKKTEA